MVRTKLTSSILLLAFAAASIGFPMPSFVPRGDADFPCRGHNCGCDSAEACRTNCCCFPAFSQKTQSSCCGSQSSDLCDDTVSDADSSFTIVIGALNCRGEAGKWLSLPPTLTTGRLIVCDNAPEIERHPPINSTIPIVFDLQPEPPPPRRT